MQEQPSYLTEAPGNKGDSNEGEINRWDSKVFLMLPIGSMYGILPYFTYMSHNNQTNVGKYTIQPYIEPVG